MRHLPLTFLMIFLFPCAKAQQIPQFYDLIDTGQCTNNITTPLSCAAFTSTCGTGWITSNGTPELIAIKGWHCTVPCLQGTANCDSAMRKGLLMVGSSGSIGEGAFKKFHFQHGLTYSICAFYSMSTTGSIGLINFAAAKGLTQPSFPTTSCQSAAPATNNPAGAVVSILGVGNTNVNPTSETITFSPTQDYEQLIVYTTSPAGGATTAILTGLFVTIEPVCAIPSIISVASGTSQVKVTFSAIPGIMLYNFRFLDPNTGAVVGTFNGAVAQPIYDPTTGAAYPTSYTLNIGVNPGTYKVEVQCDSNPACSGGTADWSGPSSTVTIN